MASMPMIRDRILFFIGHESSIRGNSLKNYCIILDIYGLYIIRLNYIVKNFNKNIEYKKTHLKLQIKMSLCERK